jgi:hypothetical protein
VEALEDRLSLFGAPIPILFPVGTNPASLVAGDFNGDGRQDLAVLSRTAPPVVVSTGVSVLLNNGQGGFAPPASYSVPSAASLAVGDFHSDDRPDLVVTTTGGAVLLLPNKRDGTFGPATTLTTVNGVVLDLAVADFTGDGKQDLAVSWVSSTNSNNGAVEVLLGHGDGTFAPPVSYAVAGPGDLAVADFTGDGRQDIAVNSSQGIALLLNQGNGTFASPLYSSSSVPGTALVAGDFHGNGRPDLVVGGSGGTGSVLLLPNKGDGTFGPPTTLLPAASNYLGGTSLAVGDFNGDGKLDLAVGAMSLPGNPIMVLLGKGDGTFNTMLSGFTGTGGPPAMAVLDFNGDGRPDLAICDGQYPIFYVILNTSEAAAPSPAGIGTFDPSTGTWYLRNARSAGSPDAGAFRYGAPGWVPVVGDWQGSGHTGIGVVDPSTAIWYLRNENSAGAPDVAAPFAYGLPGWVPVVGDWNGIGHTGIGMFDPSTATWYLRNEDSPGPPDAGVFQYGAPGWIPVVGDWARCGRTTIGVVDPDSMTWYLRNFNSAGPPDLGVFQYGGAGWRPVVGDWSGYGTTTVGVLDPAGNWYLRNYDSAGPPSVGSFAYGLGGWAPLAGTWDPSGDPLRAAGGVPAATGSGAEPLADDLMTDVLATGTRHTQALDAVFARGL